MLITCEMARIFGRVSHSASTPVLHRALAISRRASRRLPLTPASWRGRATRLSPSTGFVTCWPEGLQPILRHGQTPQASQRGEKRWERLPACCLYAACTGWKPLLRP
jgi:hypothetical protein